MPNNCKKKSERKSEYLVIRVTPKQKEHWETLAKAEGLNLSQVLRMMVDDFLEKPNWITHNTWSFLKAAADIIDKEGHANRRRGNE